MKTSKPTNFVGTVALSGLLFATGCAGNQYKRSTGAVIDDATLKAKVKSELVRDPAVSAVDVHVNTFKGNVQLTGFVNTPEQKERAAQIARSVAGVNWVKDDLVVKTEMPAAAGAPSVTSESSRGTRDDAPAQPEWQKGVNSRTQVQTFPAGGVEINVSGGKATIRGTVRSEAERDAIDKKIREIPGVSTVDNLLRIERSNP